MVLQGFRASAWQFLSSTWVEARATEPGRVPVDELKERPGRFELASLSLVVVGVSDLSFRFLDQAPGLKSFGFDCFFDRFPREVVGRVIVRPDRADGGPRTVALRQLAAHEVAREGPQILTSIPT
jgi:hypothetical protein